MFETIYELIFSPSTDPVNNTYQTWVQSGYETGGLILIFTSLIVCAVYYFVFGYKSPKYATIPKWLVSMGISGLLILILSVSLIGFKVFGFQSLGEISGEVWRFSIYNMIYGFILYFVPLSILIKYASRHCRYTPF